MNVAVILAGGKGLRFGNKLPKQMLQLGKKPVISWSVDTFHKNELIDRIIIVSEKNLIQEIKNLFSESEYPKILAIIEGGEDRSDSSYNAVISSEFKDNDIILFHDAARPFVTDEIISDVVTKVKETGACGTYVQSTDTIAIIKDSEVEYVPERKTVFFAQTPQGFYYDLIKNAHQYQKKIKKSNITDDVSLVINYGHKVSAVSGSYNNIKITNKQDLKFAEFLITEILNDK